MKRNIVLMGILMLCVNIMAFSFEGRLSFGFEYGNVFEKRTDGSTDIETYRGSPGVNHSGYFFWDNFGFFYNTSYLFPAKVTANIEGFDYFFQFNFIIGPAFKIRFTERLDMTMGLGLSLGPTIGTYNDNSLVLFNLGIGGDIGLSYSINKTLYISIGSALSYPFFNITSSGTGKYIIDSDGDRDEIKNTGRSKNYNSIDVRPFIRFGWRINTEIIKGGMNGK